MMASRKSRISYKDLTSSGSDMALEIDSLTYISANTSRWTKEDCAALKIIYANASDIFEIITPAPLDDHYKQLELTGWNRQQFYLASDSDYRSNPSRKIATIMRKITNVLRNEQEDHRRENKVDSFIMSLLEYLGFDDDPLLMHPQYDYSTIIGNDHKITSKVEYMVTRDDAYVVLIVEDKHARGVSELTDWSEPQIAGEIFGSAYHNVTLSNNRLSYPFYIYAIRVVSTNFTFYKAEITREYLEECINELPARNTLEIKRYPEQPPAISNQARMLNAWDFTNEQDRIHILKTLKGLRDSQCF